MKQRKSHLASLLRKHERLLEVADRRLYAVEQKIQRIDSELITLQRSSAEECSELQDQIKILQKEFRNMERVHSTQFSYLREEVSAEKSRRRARRHSKRDPQTGRYIKTER